jgi:hypothetical protein
VNVTTIAAADPSLPRRIEVDVNAQTFGFTVGIFFRPRDILHVFRRLCALYLPVHVSIKHTCSINTTSIRERREKHSDRCEWRTTLEKNIDNNINYRYQDRYRSFMFVCAHMLPVHSK